MIKNVHIGSLIRRKLEESPLTIAEFASQINRTRTTVYDIFDRKSIDVDMLLSISEVLHYNFLKEVYLAAYVEQTPFQEVDLISSSDRHYIVGVEVNEEQLKEYWDAENKVILRIIKKPD